MSGEWHVPADDGSGVVHIRPVTIVTDIADREKCARRMLVERADVTLDELNAAARTLSKLGEVTLDDLCKPPGFNLLADGTAGSVNADTPEWKQWAAVDDLVQESRRLGWQLGRAYFEAKA